MYVEILNGDTQILSFSPPYVFLSNTYDLNRYADAGKTESYVLRR